MAASRFYAGSFLEPFVRNRPELALKRAALAAALKCSEQTLKGWKSGRTEPSPDSYAALAELFDCEVEALRASFSACRQRKERERFAFRAPLQRQLAEAVCALPDNRDLLGVLDAADGADFVAKLGGLSGPALNRLWHAIGRLLDQLSDRARSAGDLDAIERVAVLVPMQFCKPECVRQIDRDARLSLVQLHRDGHRAGHGEAFDFEAITADVRRPISNKRLADHARRGTRDASPKCTNTRHRLYQLAREIDCDALRDELIEPPSDLARAEKFDDYLGRLNEELEGEIGTLEERFVVLQPGPGAALRKSLQASLSHLAMLEPGDLKGRWLFDIEPMKIEVWIAARMSAIDARRQCLSQNHAAEAASPAPEFIPEPQELTMGTTNITYNGPVTQVRDNIGGSVATGGDAQTLSSVSQADSAQLLDWLGQWLDATADQARSLGRERAAARSIQSAIECGESPNSDDTRMLACAKDKLDTAETASSLLANVVGAAAAFGWLG